MRLVTLDDGRAARVEEELFLPLPGRLVDHLCREPSKPSGDPIPTNRGGIRAPIERPGKVIGLGLNYADHARESGQDLPAKPLLFCKASTCVTGPGAPIIMPPGDAQLDCEAELAVVIGRAGRNIEPEEAMEFVGGYTCFNDVSERSAQLGDGQWFRGKSYDSFGPLGPWVVTPNQMQDPHDLAIRCSVNGEVRQDSDTSQMVFKIPEIVSYCSRVFTLEPGDIIATGTPPGVALATGLWLTPGDIVRVEIEGIGALENEVVESASN